MRVHEKFVSSVDAEQMIANENGPAIAVWANRNGADATYMQRIEQEVPDGPSRIEQVRINTDIELLSVFPGNWLILDDSGRFSVLSDPDFRARYTVPGGLPV